MQGLRRNGGICRISLLLVAVDCEQFTHLELKLKAEVIIDKVKSVCSILIIPIRNFNSIPRSTRLVDELSLLRSAQSFRFSHALKLPVERSILAAGGG